MSKTTTLINGGVQLKKLLFLLRLSCLALVLAACSTSNTEPSNLETDEDYAAANARKIMASEQQFEQPSSILIVADSGPVVGEVGEYSWVIAEGAAMKNTLVDSDPAFKLVDLNQAVPLTVAEKNSIQFDFEPNAYEVILWTADGKEVNRYTSLAAINEKGPYVVEIFANFPQGDVHYAFAFDLQ
jgi:hypothetical protein